MTKMMTRTCSTLIAFVVLSLSLGASANAQDAVQWRVEDGGNGHWYQEVLTGPITFWDARDQALQAGGDLASLSIEEEYSWMCEQGWSVTAWIGAYKPQGGSWGWVDGESWDYTAWHPCEPNNGAAELAIMCPLHCLPSQGCGSGGGWYDYRPVSKAPYVAGYLVEWSADCNGDGIVDYGQILDGPLIDGDENGIPDCCEESDCPSVADLDGDGCVDGTDLSALLGAWGLDDPKVGDLDGDGTVRGSDLTILLSEWSPCP